MGVHLDPIGDEEAPRGVDDAAVPLGHFGEELLADGRGSLEHGGVPEGAVGGGVGEEGGDGVVAWCEAEDFEGGLQGGG